jgi:hypothetical protein
MNADKNLLGRLFALVLILGAAYGVHAIAHGGFSCPLGNEGHSCVMAIPAAVGTPAVDAKAAPVEKADADDGAAEDEDAKLEKKAPVVPPAKP